jgi:uncharacterized integral membrane protein (TIGR00698 family)
MSQPASSFSQRLHSLAPGLVLTGAVSVATLGLQAIEISLFGRAWLDGIVLAILIGVAVRSLWTPAASFRPGIQFCARTMLEIAVMLLGASISASVVAEEGLSLLVGVALVVLVAILASYGIGRLMGLERRMAILIACGNAICGNSAIAAAAPVIRAESEDVVAAIAFTAVLGVVVVLSLPALMPLLGLSATQYGALAGLTVYAVPQVLAATAPVSAVSLQMGTLVKLLRVLMLGPVVLVLTLLESRTGRAALETDRVALRHVVPWFILGFIALGMLRSAGIIPAELAAQAGTVASFLTVLAMAALGLGVDVRAVARAGIRVTATVVLSLLTLVAISLVVIRWMQIA